MATRRRRTRKKNSKAKAFAKEALKATVKQSVSLVQGGAMAVVEHELGENTAAIVRGATVVGGIAGQALLDRNEHPHKHDLCGNLASGAMYGTGHKAVDQKWAAMKKARAEKQKNEMISQLKADMADDEEIQANKRNGVAKVREGEPVEVPKKKKARPQQEG